MTRHLLTGTHLFVSLGPGSEGGRPSDSARVRLPRSGVIGSGSLNNCFHVVNLCMIHCCVVAVNTMRTRRRALEAAPFSFNSSRASEAYV